MGKQEYELIMSKVDDIAVAVHKFPEGAQGAITTALVSALRHEDTSSPNLNAGINGHESVDSTLHFEGEANTDNRDYVAEIKKDVADYSLKEVSDKQFAAYAAYYYIERAPDNVRVEAISKVQLTEAIAIAGRKPPTDMSNPLNNAKKGKTAYLESGQAAGTFKLTALGRYHVEQELLMRDSE